MIQWHTLDTVDVTREVDTDPERGLSPAEVSRRLLEIGPNELTETGGRSIGRILWEQLSGALVLLLVGAAVVSFVLAEYKDAVVIFAIIVLNAILGFVQDYRAERAMAALKRMAAPVVRVMRGGVVQEVSSRDLVPGDLVLLEAGNIVPADCRIIESVNLRMQEAALTGESQDVEKTTAVVETPDLPLGDRRNMAYMGTLATYGRGRALVVHTAMQTELGKIAGMLQSVEREPTPLQRRLARLGGRLAVAALVIVAVVFTLGILRGQDVRLMFMTALSLAVAAVPEGLPAVATVTLALGAGRMLRREALIRKLPAVETLGSVTVICSDKTGTLTENRMSVAVMDLAGDRIDETESLHRGEPEYRGGKVETQFLEGHPSLALLLVGGALCNDAVLQAVSSDTGGDESRANHHIHALGDPTEGALVVAAGHRGLEKPDLDSAFARVAEIPFDSDRKRMTTIHAVETPNPESPDASPSASPDASLDESMGPAGSILREALGGLDGDSAHNFIAVTKGAVDRLLDLSSSVWVDRATQPLDEQWKKRIEKANEDFASSGMRVLGLAFKSLDAVPTGESLCEVERDLTFVGMFAIIDPPRPEVRDAVARCKAAGIRPVMITGDHPLTAANIAGQLGIAVDARVMTGTDLMAVDDDELAKIVEEVSVYARVAPEHKLRIVEALQNKGEIVAMTGDGVNDAPALKKADIGIAMGITGTDVSKEASDMVLLDDNFTTIVNAVEEGRIIDDNIRKFVRYVLTCNVGEIWVMLVAPFLGMPLPLLPLQILWINLVTDGLPGLAIAIEKGEPDTMTRPPHPPKARVLDRAMGIDIMWIGPLMGTVAILAGLGFARVAGADYAYWQTILFTVLTLSQMGNALAVRTRGSLFRVGLFSNLPMLGSVVLTFALQLLVIYWGPMQNIFQTEALELPHLFLCIALSAIAFLAIETSKILRPA